MGPRNRFVGHPNCFPHSVGGFCLWRRALPGASSRGVRLHSGTALRSRRRRPSSGHLWVGHMPGQARLWVGVGAIVTFGSISGSVSSDEYKDRFTLWHWCDGAWRPGIPTPLEHYRRPVFGSFRSQGGVRGLGAFLSARYHCN